MRTIALLLLFIIALPIPSSYAAKGDSVVLLHGIGRTKNNMAYIEKHLTKHNYNVINIDYPSRKKTLKELTDIIKPAIEKHNIDKSKKIHFIAHSMGGLVTRSYIKKYHPENLGKVIMLGTPNQGSETADFLKDNLLYKNFYGPAGQQLITDQSKLKELNGEIDYPLGIIAGNYSLAPISSIIIPGKDDGRVSIERTKIKGMTDHIVIDTNHTFMVVNKEVQQQALYFIEHGKFLRK